MVYQIDMEMAFATQDDVFEVCEILASEIFENFTNLQVSKPPFKRIKWRDAMQKHCSDKPDLRNPLTVEDETAFFASSEIGFLKGKTVKAIKIDAAQKSRKFFDEVSSYIVSIEGKGAAWIKINEGQMTGSISQLLTDEQKQSLQNQRRWNLD